MYHPTKTVHALLVLLAALSHKGNLTEEDEAVLFHQWLSGQIDLYHHSGRFHTDGHLGNVLIQPDALNKKKYSFVWNDFGRTTSYDSHPEKQFCHTLEQVSNFFFDLPLLCESSTWPEDQALLNHFEDLLDRVENTAVAQKIWARLSGRRMGGRVARLEHKVQELEQNVETLKEENENLKKDNEKLMKDNEKLMKDNEKLMKDNEKLKHKVQELEQNVETLKEENENLKAENENLREEIKSLKKDNEFLLKKINDLMKRIDDLEKRCGGGEL